ADMLARFAGRSQHTRMNSGFRAEWVGGCFVPAGHADRVPAGLGNSGQASSVAAFFHADDIDRTFSYLFEVFQHKILLRLVTAGRIKVVILHLLIGFLIGPALISLVPGTQIARA